MSNPSQDLSKILWNDSYAKSSYSTEQYNEHTLEQYKIYLEMADRVSGRRDIANAFFLTLHGFCLGAAGSLIDKGYTTDPKWALIFPLSVLLLLCFFWWRLIVSYKQLNGAKFQIVGEFESRLPASPYKGAEWNNLLKSGKDRKAYWPLTHLESKIPWIFAVGYIIAVVALIWAT